MFFIFSAIHHNDCMYISHHLMILGSQYRAKLPEPLLKGAATFVDYVPVLRRMGAKCMIELLLQQKLQILEILRSANGEISQQILRLGKRCWNLATSSAAVEFRLHTVLSQQTINSCSLNCTVLILH